MLLFSHYLLIISQTQAHPQPLQGGELEESRRSKGGKRNILVSSLSLKGEKSLGEDSNLQHSEG